MFWKKKEKKQESTNPFDSGSQPSSPAPSYSPTPSYTSQPQQQQEEYTTSRYGGSRYNTGDEQRNQLMGGARGNDGYNSRDEGNAKSSSRDEYPDEYDEQDEEAHVSGMKQQIKNVKQDSLASTRLALQKIHETETTAANTMNMLGQQSSQLANVNRHLDMSKAYANKAESSADELKQLNKSIFIPVVSNPFRRKEKERRELENMQKDHAEHMAERDNIRQFEYESSARILETNRLNSAPGTATGGRRGRSEADRRRYQFEEDSDDDKVEDEIDENLDLLGGAVGRLKNMALTMNTELDSQNDQINKAMYKVDPMTNKLVRITDTLNKTK
ncbi:hypothetical protein HPULCUR_006739 [Helicostylum pulchrum]|uniref:t-SNARE coiled-coil homology domain-containing protein n=1 Tax=Helicostylum pulchrum TaxID=562976 RepID=A0ABP9Y421_9FUNG